MVGIIVLCGFIMVFAAVYNHFYEKRVAREAKEKEFQNHLRKKSFGTSPAAKAASLRRLMKMSGTETLPEVIASTLQSSNVEFLTNQEIKDLLLLISQHKEIG